MTTATLSSAQRRQRSSAARTTTGDAASGINGGGGQPSSLKGKHAAEKANSTSPIPGLSSAPDWPASCSGGATTTTPAVQRLSSASEFWERCVVARQPGVLPASALDDDGGGGELGDDAGDKTQTPPSLFTAPSKWTPAYLKSKAGHVLVDVETRKDASDRFGRGGTRTKMTFADFLDKAAASFSSSSSSSSSTFSKKGGAADEGTLLYLSAQRPPKPPGRKGKKRGEGGARRRKLPLLPPAPLGPLALALADDFPVVPKLARGLVLQSVNLWCGRSGSSSSSNSSSSVSASSSSGLHHDFHDNLYAVVGGTKKFTLFPPAAVAEMRPVGGKPRFVHSNGRIVYRCQGEVGADGGDEGLVRRHEYRRWKEVMLADGVDIEEEEEEEEDEEDDDDDSDGEGGGKKRLVDDDDNSDEDDDDADLIAALAAAERGAPVADDYSEEEEEGSAGEESSSSSEDDDDDDDESKDPPSFSTLDPREPAHAALLPMHRSATVEVGPGDLLYLPCGWFHEVSSSSCSPSSSASASESICSPLHLALNFWFHPPDRARANPQNPYSRPYWRELFVETVEGGDPSSSRLRELCERQGTVVDVDDDYGFGGGGGGEEEEEEEEEERGGKKGGGGKGKGGKGDDDAKARAAAVEALREGLDELDALMAGGNSSSDGDDEDDEDEEMEEEEEIDVSNKKKKKSRS